MVAAVLVATTAAPARAEFNTSAVTYNDTDGPVLTTTGSNFMSVNTAAISGGFALSGTVRAPLACAHPTDGSWIYSVADGVAGVRAIKRNTTTIVSSVELLAADITAPFGIACHGGFVYVANASGISVLTIEGPADNLTLSTLVAPSGAETLQTFSDIEVVPGQDAIVYVSDTSISGVRLSYVYKTGEATWVGGDIGADGSTASNGLCVSPDGRFIGAFSSVNALTMRVIDLGENAAIHPMHSDVADTFSFNVTEVPIGVSFFAGDCVFRHREGVEVPDLVLFGGDTSASPTTQRGAVLLNWFGTFSQYNKADRGALANTFGDRLLTNISVTATKETSQCVLSKSGAVVYCSVGVNAGASAIVAFTFDTTTGAPDHAVVIGPADGNNTLGFSLAVGGTEGNWLWASNGEVAHSFYTTDKLDLITALTMNDTALVLADGAHIDASDNNDTVAPTADFGFTLAVDTADDAVNLAFSCADDTCAADTLTISFADLGASSGAKEVEVDLVALANTTGATISSTLLANASEEANLTGMPTGPYFYTPRGERLSANAAFGYAAAAEIPLVVSRDSHRDVDGTGVDLTTETAMHNNSAAHTSVVTRIFTLADGSGLMEFSAAAETIQFYERNDTGHLTHVATAAVAGWVDAMFTECFSAPGCFVAVTNASQINQAILTNFTDGSMTLGTPATMGDLTGVPQIFGLLPTSLDPIAVVEGSAIDVPAYYFVQVSSGMTSTALAHVWSGNDFRFDATVGSESVIDAPGAHGRGLGITIDSILCAFYDSTAVICGEYQTANTSAEIMTLEATHGATTPFSAYAVRRGEGILGVVCSKTARRCATLHEDGFEMFAIDVTRGRTPTLQHVDAHTGCKDIEWSADGHSIVLVCGGGTGGVDQLIRYDTGELDGYARLGAAVDLHDNVTSAIHFAANPDSFLSDEHLYVAHGDGMLSQYGHDTVTDSIGALTGVVENGTYNGVIPFLAFTIPEPAEVNSVYLEWTIEGRSPERLYLAVSDHSAGAKNVTNIYLSHQDVADITPFYKLTNGTGTIRVFYVDEHGNFGRGSQSVTGVTLITACSDPNLDPATNCTLCTWRFGGTAEPCSACKTDGDGDAVLFGESCTQNATACSAARCNDQGACVTKVGTTAPQQQCLCDENRFGHTCEIDNTTCANERCYGFGACDGQYEGCECNGNYATKDGNEAGDPQCTDCVDDLANFIFSWVEANPRQGGCIACKVGYYGADCAHTEPQCPSELSTNRSECVSPTTDIVNDEGETVTVHAATDDETCACFYAYAAPDYTESRCGKNGVPSESGRDCVCEHPYQWTDDAAYANNQCVLPCKNGAFYDVRDDGCAEGSDEYGGRFNNQRKTSAAEFWASLGAVFGVVTFIGGGYLYAYKSASK